MNQLGDSEGQSNPDFGQILDRARLGDHSAIGDLWDLSRRYLLLIANQDLNADMLKKFGASDVVQQSMIIANRKIEQFEGSTKSEFMAWMRQILINECRQTSRMYQGTEKRDIRREQAIQHHDDSVRSDYQPDDPHRTPSTQAAADEQIRLVQLALSQMDPEQRNIIEMRNWQELSFEEIGEVIGKSAEASRKAWSRAIVKLEQELNRRNAI